MTNRQNEIIEKAIELIAENGIQGFTIKNLANAIGVTEPAIYRHFKSKTDILCAMLNNLDEATNQFTSEILTKGYEPVKILSLILKKYFEMFSAHPYWVSVIFADEIFKNEKTLSQRIHELLNDKEKVFISVITNLQRNGEIRKDVNKKLLTLVIIGSMRLLIKKWELSGFDFDLRKEGNKLTKSLLNLVKI